MVGSSFIYILHLSFHSSILTFIHFFYFLLADGWGYSHHTLVSASLDEQFKHEVGTPSEAEGPPSEAEVGYIYA